MKPRVFIGAEGGVMSLNLSRAEAVSRNAVGDGAIGAALSLLLVCGYVAANSNLQQVLADSGAPISSLAGLVVAALAQGAVAAGLIGVWVRKLAAPD